MLGKIIDDREADKGNLNWIRLFKNKCNIIVS